MEILQGAINREDYYSVKECAEILCVTTKTIRNRIEDKRLQAVWYEIGPGQSQWLVSKEVIKAIVDKEVSTSRAVSIPTIPPALIDEIKAQLRAENDVLRQELAEIRMAQMEIAATQTQIEKTLQERDERLMQVIRERQVERQEQGQKPFWKFW